MNAKEKKENHSNKTEKSEPPRRSFFFLSLLTSHINTQTDYQLEGTLIVQNGDEGKKEM